MTSPINTLMQEHRLIEQVLGSLETWVEALEGSGSAEAEQLAGYAQFFRQFADRCHHGKEEEQLFVTLEAHGFPGEEGPLGVMRREHVQGRGHVRALTELAAAGQGWNETDRQSIAAHARAFITLLREHILKEDRVLFPVAEKFLPPDEIERLSENFETFEERVMGAGTHAQLHQLAEQLIASHPPDPAKMAAQALACAGCHHQSCHQEIGG